MEIVAKEEEKKIHKIPVESGRNETTSTSTDTGPILYCVLCNIVNDIYTSIACSLCCRDGAKQITQLMQYMFAVFCIK